LAEQLTTVGESEPPGRGADSLVELVETRPALGSTPPIRYSDDSAVLFTADNGYTWVSFVR